MDLMSTQFLCTVAPHRQPKSKVDDYAIKEDEESPRFSLFACSSMKPRRIPRALKNDTRRLYPKMLANVLNSHESKSIYDFLGYFGADEVVFTKHMPVRIRYLSDFLGTVGEIDHGTIRLDFQGAKTISNYWHLLHLIRPDEVITVEDVRIVPRENDRSLVKATIFASFTQLYEECAPFIAYKALELYGQQIFTPNESDSSSISSISSPDETDEEDGASSKSVTGKKRARLQVEEAEGLLSYPASFMEFLSVVPGAEPIDIRLAISLTMRLDADKRISAIDFGIPAIVFN